MYGRGDWATRGLGDLGTWGLGCTTVGGVGARLVLKVHDRISIQYRPEFDDRSAMSRFGWLSRIAAISTDYQIAPRTLPFDRYTYRLPTDKICKDR